MDILATPGQLQHLTPVGIICEGGTTQQQSRCATAGIQCIGLEGVAGIPVGNWIGRGNHCHGSGFAPDRIGDEQPHLEGGITGGVGGDQERCIRHADQERTQDIGPPISDDVDLPLAGGWAQGREHEVAAGASKVHPGARQEG